MKTHHSLALIAIVCGALLTSRQARAQFSQQGPKLEGMGFWSTEGSQGEALSADGNTAIVGDPYGDLSGDGVGAARVWTRSGGIWTYQTTLVGSGVLKTAFQGLSVSLSAAGDTAVVGGPADNGGSPDDGAGAVWVWTRSGGGWTQQAKLVGSGAVGNAGQGVAVSLSADGNTAIVGGPGDDSGAGAAWIWTRSGEVWTQQSKLVGSGAAGSAHQGRAVSLSADGGTAIIGGYGDSNDAGAAWVWTRSGGVWGQQFKLVGSDAVGNARQGFSVSLSADGTTAIVGGFTDNNDAGAAWVWTRSGGVWSQQSKLVGSEAVGQAGQGFSVSLSADGNTAIVGGPLDSPVFVDLCFCTTGAAWVWTRSGGTWIQQSKLVGSDGLGALQGVSVALSADGRTAIFRGENTRDAWVFEETVPQRRHSVRH